MVETTLHSLFQRFFKFEIACETYEDNGILASSNEL